MEAVFRHVGPSSLSAALLLLKVKRRVSSGDMKDGPVVFASVFSRRV